MADKYDEKLWQAEEHLARMRELANAPDIRPFHSKLSAFMTAARSVALYVLTSAEKRGQQAVDSYASIAGKRPALAFLRNTRNDDIHTQPFRPTAVVAPGPLQLTVSQDPNSSPLPDGRTRAPVITGVGTVVEWRLPDWKEPGSPEMFAACDSILQALRGLLAEAETAGIISRS